eukprot:gene4804-5053_t
MFRSFDVGRKPCLPGRRSVAVFAYQFDVSVRPYTLRKGDTLASIAQKRGLTVQQVVSINPDVKPDAVGAGQTILLPAGTLSSRDREILEGIGSVYRVYPVRKGENLSDIISKRQISKQEMSGLNPGVNLDKLKGSLFDPILTRLSLLPLADYKHALVPQQLQLAHNGTDMIDGPSWAAIDGPGCFMFVNVVLMNKDKGQLLKLPAHKFTVREREMLIGSGILPPEFFQATKNPFVIGIGALMMVCGFVLAWQRFYDEDKAIEEEMNETTA